jgi:hypothetical protein
MSSAKARLAHLLELADKGPSLRAALAEEVAELLMDWPADYPPAMRATFEALLEKAARDVDDDTRTRLITRIGSDPADPLAARILPLEILNAAFFTAAPQIKSRILERNEAPGDDDADDTPQDGEAETRLLAAARASRNCDISFAHILDLPGVIAAEILGDPSGQSLAIACKGAHLGRATFSALALLSNPDAPDCQARLSSYDDVPPHAAMRLLQSWRGNREIPRAAE